MKENSKLGSFMAFLIVMAIILLILAGAYRLAFGEPTIDNAATADSIYRIPEPAPAPFVRHVIEPKTRALIIYDEKGVAANVSALIYLLEKERLMLLKNTRAAQEAYAPDN